MKWYKFALPLDPQAWRSEESPARMLRHQDWVARPFGGKIPQKQDPEELRRLYEGVHMTDSPSLAGIYANGKASPGDPPVVIQINTEGLLREQDVDTMEDYALDTYLSEKRDQWQAILDSGSAPEDMAMSIMDSLEDDPYYESEAETVSDIIQEMAQVAPNSAIQNYLQTKSYDEEIVAAVVDMVAGRVPNEVATSVSNQFRAMTQIREDRIRGVYQIPLVATEQRPQQYYHLSEEELAEEGVRREGDQFYDKEGRLLLEYEDLDFSEPFPMTPLYENDQVPGNVVSWHGTTLSRARQALPGILSGAEQSPLGPPAPTAT